MFSQYVFPKSFFLDNFNKFVSTLYVSNADIIKAKDGNYIIRMKADDIKYNLVYTSAPFMMQKYVSLNELQNVWHHNYFKFSENLSITPPNGLLFAQGLAPTAVNFLGMQVNAGDVSYLVKPMEEKGWQAEPLKVTNLLISY